MLIFKRIWLIAWLVVGPILTGTGAVVALQFLYEVVPGMQRTARYVDPPVLISISCGIVVLTAMMMHFCPYYKFSSIKGTQKD